MLALIRTAIVALAFWIHLCTAEAPVCYESPMGTSYQSTKRRDSEEPLICVVIRTYRGHGDEEFPYLEELLHSLSSQTYSR